MSVPLRRVVLVDDHDLFRAGVRSELGPTVEVVGEAASVLDEKIVRMAVAVRARDADAFAGGAIHESQFGKFSHALGAEVSRRHVSFESFHFLGPWKQWLVVSGQLLASERDLV